MLRRPRYSVGQLSHGLAIVTATTPAGLVSVGSAIPYHAAILRLAGIGAAWAVAAAFGLRVVWPKVEAAEFSGEVTA